MLIPLRSLLRVAQMPVESQPVAQGARSSNAKEMALLQKFSETVLEYQTCPDTWWAPKFDCFEFFWC